MGLLLVCNKRGVRSPWPYIALGLLLWVAVYKSGVHASIAGVLLAFTIPARGNSSVEQTLEHALQFPVSYGVVPLFALANAGVALPHDLGALMASTAAVATAAGLLIGKPIGIAGAAWIAVRMRWASLPTGATWLGLIGVSLLGGIGFTMSLFVAALAFGTSAHLDAAKLGVLSGSLCAGALGAALLILGARPQHARPHPSSHDPSTDHHATTSHTVHTRTITRITAHITAHIASPAAHCERCRWHAHRRAWTTALHARRTAGTARRTRRRTRRSGTRCAGLESYDA